MNLNEGFEFRIDWMLCLLFHRPSPEIRNWPGISWESALRFPLRCTKKENKCNVINFKSTRCSKRWNVPQVSRVVLDVVNALEIVECDHTIAGSVQFLERFLNHLFTAFGQWWLISINMIQLHGYGFIVLFLRNYVEVHLSTSNSKQLICSFVSRNPMLLNRTMKHLTLKTTLWPISTLKTKIWPFKNENVQFWI